MPEIDINGTKMQCNQLGCMHHNEQKEFNLEAVFVI